MIWAFVDYENVGSLELLNLEQYQRLVVFCGPRHKKINFGDIPTESFCHLELIRMASTGNNNLDFHLALYLGVHHLEAGKDIEFHVVSKDKGFDGVIAHLETIGRKCRRIGGIKKKATAKKVTKKTAAKKVAKKATKKSAKKAAKKTTTKKSSKRAAVKSAKNNLGEKADHPKLQDIITMLATCPVKNRPNKKEKLINWVANKIDGDSSSCQQIVNSMLKDEIILESESGLKYNFVNKS